MLCGKLSCPILLKFYYQKKTEPMINKLNLEGSSPPSLFIGRIGFPYVHIGPLIPPIYGDTSFLDTPELWIGKNIEEIVDFRFKLVRGEYRVNVYDVNKENKIIDAIKELALSEFSVDSEAFFSKKPKMKLILNDEVQPFGPSAPLKKLSIRSMKTDHKIESVYYDTDLRASEAIMKLYKNGVLVSRIQRAFSAGIFGIKKQRRFVPTRWSITAVDSIISKELLESVKEFPIINEYRVYESNQLDNRWFVLMIPDVWSFELIEAWYPNTVWNPEGEKIVIFSDCENYYGRKGYPDIGGCYFASRLAVAEHLIKEKKQASIVIFREAHPGYIMPVGVWNVRENVRNALKGKPMKFTNLKESLNYISSKLDIKMEIWIKNSKVLKNIFSQRRILEFTN
ncbi:MAG: Nre family DNA repair protein [Nitrososphaeria archaeon]|nr:Nre family DNA repair protein [Candidatus Jingweiarchaeum tengchongense]